MEELTIRKEILEKVREFYYEEYSKKNFILGETLIPCSGRVFDENEIISLVDASLDFWLTSGRFANQFEKDFANFLGVKHCLLTNSGSSANLLAISSLTSPKLKERRLKPGDEVITSATGFPTTLNPIIQNNLVPVFLDSEIGTYNIKTDEIENAISKKTKAIFVAHTLGNPIDLDRVMELKEKYGLWVIEDNCDSLGSKYNDKYTGTFGDIATYSFYPAHHITMGEGGALTINDAELKRIIASYRDWGRDCWCELGHDDTCGKRFKWKIGKLPYGYDHKYTYSHIGYNLKITDMQAAIGVEQLKKLPEFIKKRKHNFNLLYDKLKRYNRYFILPKATQKSEPSWFGFPITVEKDAGFERKDVVKHLEDNKIATRMLFGGNITKQPAYENIKCRIEGSLGNSDIVMNNTFWIGVYPGITDEMIDYIVYVFDKFIEHYGKLR